MTQPSFIYKKTASKRALGDPALWKAFTDFQLDTYYWSKSIGIEYGKESSSPPRAIPRRGHLD